MKNIHLQLRNLIGQIELAMIQVPLSPCQFRPTLLGIMWWYSQLNWVGGMTGESYNHGANRCTIPELAKLEMKKVFFPSTYSMKNLFLLLF